MAYSYAEKLLVFFFYSSSCFAFVLKKGASCDYALGIYYSIQKQGNII